MVKRILLSLTLSVSAAQAYIATDSLQLKPSQLLEQLKAKGVTLEPNQSELTLINDLKTGRIEVDPYIPDPMLISLKKQISAKQENLGHAKILAKAVVYQAVEKRWLHDLEYTILNDISAKNFKQFEPTLIDILQNETRYIGSVKANNKIYLRFQVADWAFVSVDSQLRDAKWNIEFNSTADDNRIHESIKDIRTK